MKKLFLSALLVLSALTGAMAAWPDRPISLVKTPSTPKDPIPGIASFTFNFINEHNLTASYPED